MAEIPPMNLKVTIDEAEKEFVVEEVAAPAGAAPMVGMLDVLADARARVREQLRYADADSTAKLAAALVDLARAEMIHRGRMS